MAKTRLAKLRAGDVVIMDRSFPSWELLGALGKRGDITFQGVYVTQLGAVVRTDISTCLMTMVPYAIGARMAHADFEEEEEATATESLAYPNPVKDGTLYFNTIATSYRLTSITGTKITEGNNAHKMSVLGIPTGIYLLTLDGKTQKIVIE